jgi:uncharacterized protein YcnI
MKLRYALIATASAALLLAPAAAAHVEVTPDSVPADSDAVLAFRVPTEKKIPTVKLEIQLPAGLADVTFQPKPPWKRTTTMAKKRVTTVTWSGGKIGPGEFDQFLISAHVPNKPGNVLVFPALQTYSDGSTVRWIGAESSDTPAPHLKLEAAAPTATTTTPTSSATKESEDKGRTNLALGLGIAGLVAGLAALGVGIARRRRS